MLESFCNKFAGFPAYFAEYQRTTASDVIQLCFWNNFLNLFNRKQWRLEGLKNKEGHMKIWHVANFRHGFSLRFDKYQELCYFFIFVFYFCFLVCSAYNWQLQSKVKQIRPHVTCYSFRFFGILLATDALFFIIINP